MQSRYPMIYTLVLFVVAGGLALTSGGTGGRTPSAAVAASPAALPQLEGTWAGTWTDTLYSVGGAMTFVIWAEGNSYAATGTIDVTEIDGVLGVLNGGGTGIDNGSTLTGDFTCTNLGNGSVTLTPVDSGTSAKNANATGFGTVTAPLNFGAFTLTGTAMDTEITGSFDFTNPGGGKGVAQMTKTSVPVTVKSWGEVKAGYLGQ